MKDLPNIDPARLTPRTKSDRNLPIGGAAGFNPRSTRDIGRGWPYDKTPVDEIAMAERMCAAAGKGYGTPNEQSWMNYCAAHGIQHGPVCKACTPVEHNQMNQAAFDKLVAEQADIQRAHSHYFKDVSKLRTIDVYRALTLFNVTDPCLQHAVKKLLVAGGRGGDKDINRDIQEAIDTLARWQEMRAEEGAA